MPARTASADWRPISTPRCAARLANLSMRSVRTASGSRWASQRVAATNGHDVQLTIRSDLRWYAQNALAQKIRRSGRLRHRRGAKRQDRRTPGPRVPTRPSTPMICRRASGKMEQPGLLGGLRARLDRRKVVTAAAALEEGKVSPSTPMVVPYSLHRSDRTFSDSHAHPTEYLTFAGALAQSSNTGIILVSETLRRRSWRVFPASSASAPECGLLPRRAPVCSPSPVTGWVAALHRRLRTGPLDHGDPGRRGLPDHRQWRGAHRPSLIKATQNASGTMVAARPRAEPRHLQEHRDPAEPDARGRRRLRRHRAGRRDRRLPRCRQDRHGQLLRRQVGNYRGYTASFIGYAPAADPELVVSVIVQKPTSPYYGGLVAALFSTTS